MKTKEKDFNALQGETLIDVSVADDDDVITFKTKSGRTFIMHHVQDCCESVWIESINGDLAAICGTEILCAEERTSTKPPPDAEIADDDMWTFYTIRTVRETVDIRWHGSSNGYYSVAVNFDEILQEGE